MSEYILVQIAKEHLPYEIDMLRGTFELLKEIDATGGVAETDLAKQLFRNAFIEILFVFTRDRFSTSFLIVELLRPVQSQGTLLHLPRLLNLWRNRLKPSEQN